MKRILTILAAIACLCSCEKQEQSHWLYNMWSGEYDITMTNNDTGEHEPYVASISLEFSDDRSECTCRCRRMRKHADCRRDLQQT